MARFVEEPAKPSATETWNRVKQLVAARKTVEVLVRTEDGRRRIYLRVWTGKRGDGSNKVGADPDLDY